MFTGIVRELGRVVSVEDAGGGLRIEIDAPETATLTAVGDSVAIDGCCLTATAVGGACLRFDAVPETIARTALSALAPGADVNVEPALRSGEPLGGHYVQGHVDGVGTVTSLDAEGDGARLAVEIPADLRRYLVEKGSVTLQGVSLTVAALTESGFEVALIPHTLEVTTLGRLGPGDHVNLEADVLAKYVERLLAQR